MAIKSVNSATLNSWLKNNEAVLIDVREVIENKTTRIEGSTLIPLGEVSHDKLPEIKGKKLVIHCKSGGRSSKACQKLLAENANLEIFNLEGGISDWQNQGFTTLKDYKSCLPLERQVQLTAGSLAFVGTILGFFIDPAFLAIPAFVGAGLMFSGLTGWCGLGFALAKLPCNKSQNNFCQTK